LAPPRIARERGALGKEAARSGRAASAAAGYTRQSGKGRGRCRTAEKEATFLPAFGGSRVSPGLVARSKACVRATRSHGDSRANLFIRVRPGAGRAIPNRPPHDIAAPRTACRTNSGSVPVGKPFWRKACVSASES
jgi:hypothetical protein